MDRRRLLGTGISAGLAALPFRVMALPFHNGPLHNGPFQDGPSGDAAETEARLLTNLVTRMGGRTVINGQAGFVFVLDTGAGRTAVADDLAARLALPLGPEMRVHGVTAAEPAPSVRIDRLNFSGRSFTGLQAPVFRRALLAADGLLGLDVLSGFRITFDLRRRRVWVREAGRTIEGGVNPVGPSGAGRGVVAARRGPFGQLLILDARMDGVAIEAFVDSGAQYSIGNLALRDALTRRSVQQTHEVRVYGVNGQSLTGWAGTGRNLLIGSRTLDAFPALFADLYVFDVLGLKDRPALLMGADLLTRFADITLDFPYSRVRFGPVRRG